MIQTLRIKATEIKVVNTISTTDPINIEIKHDYKVLFSPDGDKCKAIMQLGIVHPEAPDEFTILATVIGDFQIDKVENDDDKKQRHVDCYYRVFPYAQTLVARLCMETGMPPFYCQEMVMDKSLVNVEK